MSDSNIDSELLQTQVFINGEEPVVFFIPLGEDDRDELVSLVTENGGLITDNSNQDNVIYISKYGEVHHDTFDTRYIYDCILNKKLLNLENYKNVAQENAGDVQQLVSYLHDDDKSNDQAAQDSRVLNAIAETRAETAPKRQNNVAVASKNGFSEEEDQIILEQVRQNPQRRSSHKLFYEIAKMIGRHTGNSIRYRYRNNLVNHLEYVYKTDSNGELIRDSDGKLIKVQDLPSTLKRKFVASEDFELATAIKNHLKARDNFTPLDKAADVTLPGKFFENMALQNPNHSKSAWRDRYRKFLVPYGIDKYIDYYNAEISANRIPNEIKNFTGKHLYKSKKNLNNIENEIGSKLSEHNNQFEDEHQHKKRKTPGNYSKSHDADLENNSNDSTNVFIAGDHDDLHDLENSNYYNTHTAVAVAQASTQDTPPNPEYLLSEELVTQKFLTFQPPLTILDKITEIVERTYDSTDAENLIEALYQEAGIQKRFGTFIITSVCGDLSLIPKYIELFLRTGENPPSNCHGIWTKRDDEYLQSGDEEKINIIRELHGDKRIDLRKQFISQELI